MTIRALPSLVLLAFAIAPLAGQEKRDPTVQASAAGTNARFEQFKKLAGEWVGKEPGKDGKPGMDLHVVYKVTSGGSAVVETISPGTEHEMVTVIHPDGDDILLTHYCMLGNQPQMKASGKGDPNKVEFKFVRATNMKSDKEMHMHDVTFTFVNNDTLRAEWTHFSDGKAGDHAVFEVKRKVAAK
jgi:hypothetical protein